MTTLRDPFAVVHKKDIKNKAGDVVAQVDYVGWSQVADRLDDVAPGWSFEIRQLGEDWCWGKLTIGGQTFENVGYAENADAAWKKEALKDAVSDSLKRCAALAGVARYLYDKDAPVGRQNGHAVATQPVAVTQRSSTAVPEDLGDFDFAQLSPVRPATREAPAVLSGTVAVTDRPSLSDGENWCPVHGLAWVLKPAGVSKAGAPYDPFWACASKDKPWCKEKPTAQWVAAHHP